MNTQDRSSADSSNAETSPLDVVTGAIGAATAADDAVDQGTGDEGEGDSTAQSSSANDAEKPSEKNEEIDLLSVVRDAVEGKDPKAKAEETADDTQESKDDGASSASGKAESQEKPAETAEEADPTKEELEGYKPKTRKQIERLLAQRAELRDQVESLQDPAKQYEQITSYMGEYGLTANDVASAFALTAMFKHDPAKCREELQKRIDILDEQLGNRIPEDLRKKIDDGALDEDSARELSRAKAEARREREARARYEEQQQQERQQSAAVEVASKVKSSVQEWHREKLEKDPDFQQKAPLLGKYVQALVTVKGKPQTPERAREMAEEAYANLTKDLEAVVPKPSPTPKRVVPSRHISGNPRPTPSTPLDVVKMAVGGTK